MNEYFEDLLNLRRHLANILEKVPREKLVEIPDGFVNNIFWNIAHCVATQQLLHYYLSDLPMQVESGWVEMYKKGSLPSLWVEEEEVEQLDFLLSETPKLLIEHYDEGWFCTYRPYTTQWRIDLRSIQDAVRYNNLHEAWHLGYIHSLQRALELK